MNKVILSGNLCQDIELKQTPSGKSVVTNCIAVKRDYKNESGNYDSDFINIVVWGAQAEYLHRYAKKGERVELVGRWNVRKYQAQDGTNRLVNECTVESITVFSRSPKAETETAPATTNFEEIDINDDVPF